MKNFSEFLIFHKRHAFSLVEMLMALLVASLLLAALAPVMTRKLSETVNVSGVGGAINPPAGSYCWSTSSGGGSSNIKLDSNGNRVVKYKTEPNVFYVNFALASGGGGGGGASQYNSVAKELTGGNGTSLKIEANMGDFDIVSLIGGGGGGGGGAGVAASVTCTGSVSANKCACMGGYVFDSKNNLCVSKNMGTATFSNASSKCTSLPKDTNNSGWSVPTRTQLANWNTLYSDLNITSGTKIWSKTSASGSCASSTTKYSCYCDGSYRSGYSSSSSCCSGCSYGSTAPKNKSWSYTTCSGNVRTYSTTMYLEYCSKGCYEGVSGNLSGCQNAANHCSYGNWGSFVRCDKKVPAKTGGDSCSASSQSSCNSYYTNYYYGTLSGSSWSTTYTTSSSTSNNVRCIYSGTGDVNSEGFYSLSGGGGGGAPAIQNNNINSNVLATFRQRIKENIGGYIVLEIGGGGGGGAGASNKAQKATNGSNGGQTCIAITDSSKTNVKYRICSPGGKGGGAGNGAAANASTAGWGAAGAGTGVSGACYAIDYTSGTAQTETFDCSTAGKAGGNGGASSSNPVAGGKGGASVVNSTQVGGTQVVAGVNASSSNYGAGGGGASANLSGSSYSYGKGGNGAGGSAKLAYKIKYDAGGGGGGGAGNLAIIKEYRVNQAECTFTIGRGGAGGSVSTNGKNGGDTSVICTTAGGETFKVYGGEGGKTGTTASTLGGQSTGGAGGRAAIGTGNIAYSEDIISLAPSKKTTKSGLAGTAGGVNDNTYTNYIPGSFSAGGRGGTSGAGKKGACGAMLNDVVCTYSHDITPNADAIKGGSMPVGDVKFLDMAVAESYGESSAGGGGGAWQIQTGSGAGGDGLGGYACIWWEKTE